MLAKFRRNGSAIQLLNANQMPATYQQHVSHMSATFQLHVSNMSETLEILKILVNSNISIIIASQERNFVLVSFYRRYSKP